MNNLLYIDDLKLFGITKDDLDALMNIVRLYTDDIKMDDHYKIKHSCVVLLSVIPTDSDSG